MATDEERTEYKEKMAKLEAMQETGVYVFRSMDVRHNDLTNDECGGIAAHAAKLEGLKDLNFQILTDANEKD